MNLDQLAAMAQQAAPQVNQVVQPMNADAVLALVAVHTGLTPRDAVEKAAELLAQAAYLCQTGGLVKIHERVFKSNQMLDATLPTG